MYISNAKVLILGERGEVCEEKTRTINVSVFGKCYIGRIRVGLFSFSISTYFGPLLGMVS
jgi:hypothetical protein